MGQGAALESRLQSVTVVNAYEEPIAMSLRKRFHGDTPSSIVSIV